MKWFFALNESSPSWVEDVKLTKVAVYTALQNTSLEPFCVYDGSENALTDWLRSQGVKVIHHRTCHYDKLAALGDRHLQIGAGSFLSVEVPKVAEKIGLEEPLLLTDIAVMFMKNVVEYLQEVKFDYLAVARDSENQINSQLLLLQ